MTTPAYPFIIEGVEDDGSRTLLQAFDNSASARHWLSGYTRYGDSGGWNLIEIYDTRGEDAERIAFFERD
jgi:hypothetical protein